MNRSIPLRRPRPALRAGACTLTLVLIAACGAGEDEPTAIDSPDEQASSTDAFPVTVASGPLDGGTEVVIEYEPTSIVSLSPTSTETLFAIDAGDRVIAVDDQSNYPEDAPVTELSGHQPNIEAILEYEPDLVVAADDMNNLVAAMEAAGVPTLLMPAAVDLDEAYSQMERLGAATGNVAEATGLVADVQAAMEEATSGASHVEGMTVFHELDPALYTVTGDTFIGQLYAEFGIVSIADEAGGGDPYPQLNSEYVVQTDPDLIVLTDSQWGDVTVENVAERAGWDEISAVRNGLVVELDPDIASRWGPRVAEFAELIASTVVDLDPATTG